MPANKNLIETFSTFRYLVMKKILVEIPQRFKRNTCQLMVKKCALRLVNSFWEGCLETVFRTKNTNQSCILKKPGQNSKTGVAFSPRVGADCCSG